MRKFTKAAVLTCVVVALLAAAVLMVDVQVGGELEPVPEPIEVRVFADKYSVNGRIGTNLDSLLKGHDRGGEGESADIVVSASEGIGYWRLKDTIARLKDAGFEKVALASDNENSR